MEFKRTVFCTKTYIEDDVEYWTKGCYYDAIKHRDGNWSIKTNVGNIGGIGPAFMINDFDEFFYLIQNKR